MTIRSEGDIYIPVCDSCGDTLPGKYELTHAVKAMSRAAWETRQTIGDWEDICVSCQIEEEERGGQQIWSGQAKLALK